MGYKEVIKKETFGAEPQITTGGYMKTLGSILFFVIGPMITVFSLLSYDYSSLGGMHYYYSLESKLGIAIGVGLICIGLVFRRKR